MMATTKRAETAPTVPTLNEHRLAGRHDINPIAMELMMQSNTTTRPDRAMYLETSRYDADGGNLIGKDPRQIPLDDLRALRHPESPIKSIRAKCIDCSGGNMAEVRKCTASNCALWPLRMGSNPFHASSASSKLQMGITPLSSEGRA